MKTSIATVSVSGNLREKLEAIAAAGFSGIEIFEQDSIAHDGSPGEVGRMVRDHGLETTLFQPFRDFEGLPEPLLSWTLFYTSIFDMPKLPMVDVIDPDGLVRSQTLAAPGGALRITLNGADSQRTLAGQLLSDTFGAPIQHIALATDDIFATADRLHALGFDSLPMPENYYRDLVARFDLLPRVIEALQLRDILYGAEGDGEYFQMYSRAFAGGVFLEIVERRNGYAGYGAPNAPFRIAAQKRLMRTKGVPTL